MPELLAPAGSPESLAAALKAGADAVYLGLQQFSARAGADNFSPEAYRQAKAECAAAGVKVYVTLNTLLTQRQLPEMEQSIRLLAREGCDGVIVQDLATARLVRTLAPTIPLHASTQMCIYNLEGAKLLEQLGFTRVVLARELSVREVATIARGTSLEIEVFVHGALCMCYSGHCYFSAVVGRNSGNRGRCAQPCRLPYEGSYPLSLKDLSLLSHLDKLAKVGVTSLKIEGRLKSPEYVGGVTHVFARALRGETPTEETVQQLAHLFSREGFTDGYWADSIGAHMFGTKQPTAFKDYKTAVQALTRHKPPARFPLDVTLTASTEQNCRWEFSDGVHCLTLESPPAAPAQSKPLTEADLLQRLDKLQDTYYYLQQCHLHTTQDVFLPVSLINEMRRQGLAALDARRSAVCPHPLQQAELSVTPVQQSGGMQVLYRTGDCFAPQVDHSAMRVVWLPPEAVDCYQGENRGVFIDHFYPAHQLTSLLDTLWQQGIRRVLVGNLGHILPAKAKGMEVWGDYGLNITNGLSLDELRRLELVNATLSFELSLPQIRHLPRSMPTTMIVYGRLPLMQFKNCVIRSKGRCIDHKGFATLQDRTGATFLLSCRPGCGNTLYNSLPLLLENIDMQGLDDVDKRFDFTDESPQQVAEIIYKYTHAQRPDGQFTAGLYKRGVI